MPQIEIDQVYKIYKTNGGDDHIVLDGVSLTCEQGDFVALLGPSGCGKTTLLNMIAGLDKPTRGTVRFNGVQVRGPGPDRGVIFQHYSLFPWLTVRKNVEFGLRYLRTAPEEKRRRVDEVLESVGLTMAADRLPKQLSGGMKQRCALARALVVNPQTILMDEPFGALDALTRRQLQMELLSVYTREQKTIIFVTHDVDEAVFLAQRIVIMAASPGKIQDIVDVPLPRVRTAEILMTETFTECRRQVWELMPPFGLDGEDRERIASSG